MVPIQPWHHCLRLALRDTVPVRFSRAAVKRFAQSLSGVTSSRPNAARD
jgi:hypothetical protein